MGIQGLLRNLHPLLVPPPAHHSNSSNNNNEPGPPPQRNNPSIRHNIRQFRNRSLAIDA
eukprot:CAMPEP_0181120774 /NCGR_PEP_ID=MMETSP1071-20121207/24350_1 /TAXON_ID=35127 /ORGANISM="Thalassiosira sp., Strain NH16" /LENGTH=58 /DNA_ID=CAMNT_0023205481 /DNA_START=38 /DNA_END=210 /DNA_ORIENTATION=-